MKFYFYLVFMGCLLLLQACSTTSHQDFFEAHEKTFKAKNNYRTHFIEGNAGKIHAREFGQLTSKPTFILMHGFPDSMHLYDRLIPEFPKTQHTITFDFIGWGDSDKPKQHRYNFASLRSDLDTVINHFQLDKVVLVVHDSSGIPGIEWALEHPKRVAGLVLLNTFYSPMPTLNSPDAIKLFSTHGVQRTVSIWATSLSDALWQKRYNEQIAKFISTKELREPFQKILGYQSFKIRNAFFGLNDVLQQSVQERAARVPQLRNFTRPVLIVFGNDDLSLNAGVAKEFHKIFPNSQLALVKNAGHFVQIDAPKRVAHLLEYFMKSNNLK